MAGAATERATESTTRRRGFRATAMLVGVALALGTGEAATRLLSTSDADGNMWFLGRRLRPLIPPVNAVREALQNYECEAQCLREDPQLGWAPRPGSTSADGLYSYDASGIRIRQGMPDYSMSPPEGTLRIALFGDSFTHCDGLAHDGSWGHLLEGFLGDHGVDAEVLNLGFSGYGMDQALLRWRSTGRILSPHLVVFGFQAENVARNRNLVRALYSDTTDFPFTKPRFLLDGDELRLITVPRCHPRSCPRHLATLSRGNGASTKTPGMTTNRCCLSGRPADWRVSSSGVREATSCF